MDQSKIVILDFSTAEVHIHDYNELYYENIEDFLIEKGYKEGDCHYMIVKELKLTIH
jgi:hypothetical protein